MSKLKVFTARGLETPLSFKGRFSDKVGFPHVTVGTTNQKSSMTLEALSTVMKDAPESSHNSMIVETKSEIEVVGIRPLERIASLAITFAEDASYQQLIEEMTYYWSHLTGMSPEELSYRRPHITVAKYIPYRLIEQQQAQIQTQYKGPSKLKLKPARQFVKVAKSIDESLGVSA